MAIEINTHNTTPPQTTEAGGQPRSAAQAPQEQVPDKSAPPAQTTDQVSLTPTAQQLRGLEQQVANQPVVDTQKVNAVREALSNGSFQVDSDRIAGKMMSLEKALGDLS
ncbi:MAG: flagellar biosynthesis anti-sigma factor FlgM [Gammaproteobacteria bacterium]